MSLSLGSISPPDILISLKWGLALQPMTPTFAGRQVGASHDVLMPWSMDFMRKYTYVICTRKTNDIKCQVQKNSGFFEPGSGCIAQAGPVLILGWGVVHVIESLPSKLEALSSNSSTAKKTKKVSNLYPSPGLLSSSCLSLAWATAPNLKNLLLSRN
jgi:hypothetical protein